MAIQSTVQYVESTEVSTLVTSVFIIVVLFSIPVEYTKLFDKYLTRVRRYAVSFFHFGLDPYSNSNSNSNVEYGMIYGVSSTTKRTIPTY